MGGGCILIEQLIKLVFIFCQHEQLSASVFEHHIYAPAKEKLFTWHGIGDEEVRFIKELIDHNFSEGTELKYPERRFLYEVDLIALMNRLVPIMLKIVYYSIPLFSRSYLLFHTDVHAYYSLPLKILQYLYTF